MTFRHWMPVSLLLLAQAVPAMEEDPLLYQVLFKKFELRDGSDSTERAWDMEAWLGYDRDRVVLKSEGERDSDATEEFELQLLYSRAISPFWNLRAGWRGDFQPEQRRNWAALGLSGLAPGFIHTELELFLGEGGRSAVRLEADYDLYLSQRLVLQPQLETSWYGKRDAVNGVGEGLDALSLALRLRYEWRRELAPYAGVQWAGRFGDGADLARQQGAKVRDIQWLVGLRWWF